MGELRELRDVRYVVDQEGKRAAVQVSIEDWRALLSYLEDLEDRTLVRNALARLKQGPEQSQALPWQEARDEW